MASLSTSQSRLTQFLSYSYFREAFKSSTKFPCCFPISIFFFFAFSPDDLPCVETFFYAFSSWLPGKTIFSTPEQIVWARFEGRSFFWQDAMRERIFAFV